MSNRRGRLADSGAAYFASHPTAKSMLALMQKGGLPYVAHEYFHADWQPMYFADVARVFGLRGIRVEDPSQLQAALKDALASDETVIVDVATDIDCRAPEPWLPAGV